MVFLKNHALRNIKGAHNGRDTNVSNNEAFSCNLENNTWVRSIETNYTLLQGAGSILSSPFGLGLVTIPFYNKSGIGHSGKIDGFESVSVYFPSDNVYVSFVSNGVNMPFNDIAIGILSIYSGIANDLP